MPRPAIQPRILTKEEAAQYCGFASAHRRFAQWCSDWAVEPLPRAHHYYDQRDLDAGIDREKGIAPASMPKAVNW